MGVAFSIAGPSGYKHLLKFKKPITCACAGSIRFCP